MGELTWGYLAHRRRALIALGVVAVVALSVVVLKTAGGASAQEVDTATARKGTLVVTAGGVGKIVEAKPTIQLFPRMTGVVSRVLVKRGQRVRTGQLIAVLDDGGVAAAASALAKVDIATARLDLLQKRAARRTDVRAARQEVLRARADLEIVLGGPRSARQRAITTAQRNVDAAEMKLEQLSAPPSAADVSAAQAEVRRTEAALAALRAPRPGPTREAIAAAEQAVVVARQNLARAQASGTPAEISAAQLELYRAEAEVANLRAQPAGPLPEEIAAAEAAVESARANLRRLFEPARPADVAAARLEVERARAELTQLSAGPSSAQRASAKAAIQTARTRLTQTKSPLTIQLARQGIESARARLTSARVTEDGLALHAPADGTITAIVAAGAFADLTTSIATIGSLDELAVNVDLSEFDVARVEVGQRATVSVDALGGEEFVGRVTYVAPSGVDTNGVITFPVQVALDYAEDVKAGMTVNTTIVVARRAGTVIVPLEAVTLDEEDNAFVTVLTDAATEQERRVVIGLSNTTSMEILKGLKPGEEVLLAQPEVPEEE